MTTIRSLADLTAWQEARKLCRGVYVLTKKFPIEEKYNLIKHLKESARGTASNIAEGFGRYFFKESLKFYGIARGCLEEIGSDLYISFDNQYIEQEEFNKYIIQVNKVNALISGLIASTNIQIKTSHEAKNN